MRTNISVSGIETQCSFVTGITKFTLMGTDMVGKNSEEITKVGRTLKYFSQSGNLRRKIPGLGCDSEALVKRDDPDSELDPSVTL